MRRVFVSSTSPELQPVRAKVVERLHAHGYVIVSENPSLTLFRERKRQIDACDLFLAILPPKEAALPVKVESYTLSPPLDELRYASKTFRDCLVYVARPDFPKLRILVPPLREEVSPERVPALADPPPPTILAPTSIDYWKQLFRSLLWNEPTPAQSNDAARDEYARKLLEKLQLRNEVRRRQPESLAARQADANARFEQKRSLYEAKMAAAEALNSEIENFRYRDFNSEDELLGLLDDDLTTLETAGYLPCTKHRREVLERWAQTNRIQRRAIQRELDSLPGPLGPSPAESLLPDFYAASWHERVRRQANAVVKHAAVLTQDFGIQEVRETVMPYCHVPVDCGTERYEVIEDELWDWVVSAMEAADGLKQWVAKQKEKRGRKADRTIQSAGLHEALKERVNEWWESVDVLCRTLQSASYGKCLLVSGRSGSGKSHFIARLLQQHGQLVGNFIPYYLHVPPGVCADTGMVQTSIETLLLQTARFSETAGGSGLTWRSFDEFVGFVGQLANAKLVIVLDDLDVWLNRCRFSVQELQAFVRQHTHLHHLSWIMCVREHQYHLISDVLSGKFWKRYALHYKGNTDGWVELDLLNESATVWRSIILAHLEPHQGRELDAIVAQLHDSTRRLIELPFLARLFAWFLHESRPIHEMRNLNYVEFVLEYWRRRTAKLLHGNQDSQVTEPDEAHYWRALYLISGLIAEQAATELGASDLASRLREADAGAVIGFGNSADEIVEALVTYGLLRTRSAPDEVSRYGHRVSPGGFPPLWHWMSGRYLVDALRGDDLSVRLSLPKIRGQLLDHFDNEELRDLCFELDVKYDDLRAEGRAGKARELVERLDRKQRLGELLEIVRRERPTGDWPVLVHGNSQDDIDAWLRYRFEKRWSDQARRDFLPNVLEFFLLLLDQAESRPLPWQVAKVVSGTIRLFPPYQAQVWLAATKTSAAFQHALARWLKTTDPSELVVDVGLYQYLYFLKYAAPGSEDATGLTCVLRMQLLRPFYHTVRPDGYLRSMLEQMMRTASDPLDVARSMAYLDGIEPYLDSDSCWGDAKLLADWVYSRFEQLAVQGQELRTSEDAAWTRFRRIHELMLAFIGEIKPFVTERVLAVDQRQKHWIQLVAIHSEQFAPFLSLDSMAWLEESRWFDSKESVFAADILEEQLTVYGGLDYRKSNSLKQQAYEAVIMDWASPNSSASRKRTAFFLIKHTVPSPWESNLKQVASDEKRGPSNKKVRDDLWEIVERLIDDHDQPLAEVWRAVDKWIEGQRTFRQKPNSQSPTISQIT